MIFEKMKYYLQYIMPGDVMIIYKLLLHHSKPFDKHSTVHIHQHVSFLLD